MTTIRTSALGHRIALEMPLRGAALLAASTLVICALLLASLSLGSAGVGFNDAMAALFGSASERADLVAIEFRLPRALTALMAGGLLALSGALLQGTTLNPLADPALIGVSQGAGLAVVALAVLLPNAPDAWSAPAAFGGGLVVAILILALTGARSGASTRFLLIGIGIAAFLTALTTAILTYGRISEAHEALGWLAGSVRSAGWDEVRQMGWVSVAALAIMLLAARPLSALRLGDDLAASLGHIVSRARVLLLFGSVGLAAASVSVVGPITFVGLLAPHAARRLAPTGPGLHLALSWAVGACLTLAADLAGRAAFGTNQVPAGLVTALVGAPCFALLMLRKHRKESS
ncbi:iron chelate uptake ABC transporter family permease subunit [Roseivivax sp. THAF30]|uniref:FecCD family ABC transporter permease n=1 Tax=Roseivivax sp. THAF30 TaxID=2587852 RepID=UPI001267D23F|nr:iron ABC transporter permease [Roseivivax sp. THAF30]QFT62875.1 putative siderophore transport system permease protein YfhA [Roseivivax sp. THAF30]